MFHLGSHGQDHGAEGVACGSEGVGGLFGMAALAVTAAAGAVTGLDVELGDDGDDGRQIGLILDNDLVVIERGMAVGTFVTGHVDDAIDLVGSRDGAECGLVPLGASRLFECAGFRLLASERVRLAVLFAAGLVQALAEIAVLYFHLGQAAFQALVIPPKGLDFLGQQGEAAAQVQDLAVPFLTARTRGTTGKNGNLPSTVAEKQVGQRVAFLRGASPS
jgi:hypothetical protein